MKIKTTQAVFVSSDEINSLLTKFVEKKTSKKVTSASPSDGGVILHLVEEESDLTLDSTKQQ
jgi:hypothetical protein